MYAWYETGLAENYAALLGGVRSYQENFGSTWGRKFVNFSRNFNNRVASSGDNEALSLEAFHPAEAGPLETILIRFFWLQRLSQATLRKGVL